MKAFDRATIVVGAAMAACGPFAGCYSGFGDNVQVTSGCVEEGTNRLACFEYNTISVSCMLTPTIGGAIFAAGTVLFYSVYARYLVSLVARLRFVELSDSFLMHRTLYFVCIFAECVGMLTTVMVPMITHTASVIHTTGFSVWMVGGVSLSVVMGARAFFRTDDDAYDDTTRRIICTRMIMSPILFVTCVCMGVWRESTGPFFRCTEYSILLFLLATGTWMVFLDTGSVRVQHTWTSLYTLPSSSSL
jgi:hypothetical protein